MLEGTGCILSWIKKRVYLKDKLTQLDIIEVKHLIKVSARRAEMGHTEIKWKVNIKGEVWVD